MGTTPASFALLRSGGALAVALPMPASTTTAKLSVCRKCLLRRACQLQQQLNVESPPSFSNFLHLCHFPSWHLLRMNIFLSMPCSYFVTDVLYLDQTNKK